jgi:hypothetical protein
MHHLFSIDLHCSTSYLWRGIRRGDSQKIELGFRRERKSVKGFISSDKDSYRLFLNGLYFLSPRVPKKVRHYSLLAGYNLVEDKLENFSWNGIVEDRQDDRSSIQRLNRVAMASISVHWRSVKMRISSITVGNKCIINLFIWMVIFHDQEDAASNVTSY